MACAMSRYFESAQPLAGGKLTLPAKGSEDRLPRARPLIERLAQG